MGIGYGRPARNRALWNDCTAATWARVCLAYMLVYGVAHLASFIADPLLRGTNPLLSLWTGNEWKAVGGVDMLIDRWRYVAESVEIVVLIFVGIVLWRRPKALFTAMCIACPFVLVTSIFGASVTIAKWFQYVRPTSEIVTTAPMLLWHCALPVCALWAAWRVRADKHIRVMVFVAGALATYGLCLSLVYAPGFLDLGPDGICAMIAGERWAEKLSFLTIPLVPLACLCIGGWLLVSRSKPLVTCASILVVCTAASAAAWVIPTGWVAYLFYEPAPAVAFLVFVLAYRPRGDPTNPTCDTCGYSLRGLPESGHRCPECGSEFELVPGATQVAAHDHGA